MKKELNNEELQNRREFFKKAAKAALPVVGAVVLANLPIAKSEAATGCHGGGCVWSCDGGCQNACEGCKDSCYGSCKGSCNAQVYY